MVILDAAESAFAKDGLSRARIEDVAAVAGVAVGTVYNHFADREALVKMLLERRRTEALSMVDTELAKRCQAPFAARLEAVLSAMVDHFDAHRAFYSLLFEDEGQCGRSRRHPTLSGLVARLEKLVAAGVAEHALREDDAELYPQLVAGMFRGLLFHALRAKNSAPLGDVVKPMVRLFMEGAAP